MLDSPKFQESAELTQPSPRSHKTKVPERALYLLDGLCTGLSLTPVMMLRSLRKLLNFLDLARCERRFVPDGQLNWYYREQL